MKSFIYTYAEKAPRRDTGGGVAKTVRVYQIVKGVPALVCERTEYSVTEFQIVMHALEAAKALPKAAFKPGTTGEYKHCAPYLLEAAGFARINRVD